MTGPATIEQLARETVEITDPETALRALTALRRELDATEPEIVQRALHAGASWSQIARALGVSKQAAHRKYRHMFDQVWGEKPGTPRLTISNEARRSVQFAHEEAQRLGQPAIGTEHILLAILRCEDSLAARALNAEGVTPGASSRAPGARRVGAARPASAPSTCCWLCWPTRAPARSRRSSSVAPARPGWSVGSSTPPKTPPPGHSPGRRSAVSSPLAAARSRPRRRSREPRSCAG